jgi:hypothetical protein
MRKRQRKKSDGRKPNEVKTRTQRIKDKDREKRNEIE